MTTKFKLVISVGIPISLKRKILHQVAFVWDNRADAIACKDLLDKCPLPKYATMKFVEFVEEIPL